MVHQANENECAEIWDGAQKGARTGDGIRASVERRLSTYFAAHKPEDPITNLYACVIQEVEMPLIQQTLDFTGGNQTRAAEILGLNRNTLRKKIQEYNIKYARTSRSH